MVSRSQRSRSGGPVLGLCRRSARDDFGRFLSRLCRAGPGVRTRDGHRLITTRGPSIGDSPEAIPTGLARGEFADVVILDGGSADELAKRGFVRAGSKVDLALSQIGMVV